MPDASATPASRTAWRAALAVLALVFSYAYADVGRTLWRQWATNDVYSHGFLIPPLSLYLAWRLRHALIAAAGAPWSVAGLVCLAAGLALLEVGRLTSLVGLQEVSLLPALSGIALMLGGLRALALLAFPIGYLVFMMPIWDVVIERLHLPSSGFPLRSVPGSSMSWVFLCTWRVPSCSCLASRSKSPESVQA